MGIGFLARPCITADRMLQLGHYVQLMRVVVVVVLRFCVPPTSKVIRRRDLGLKSHPKDWRSPGTYERDSSFFIYMIMKPKMFDKINRVGQESERLSPT